MNYISKYSNGKEVSAAQYITELICENKAKQEKKDLHYRFWSIKEWSKFYRNQIATANKLVKKYNEQAIIRALKTKDGERIYSLRAPHLAAIIEKEQDIVSAMNTKLSKEYNRSADKKYRVADGKSIISKLKELE